MQEQDEYNAEIMKNDMVVITKQNISGKDFVDIELYAGGIMNNEYSAVGLYDYNADSYKKVSDAFRKEDIVAIVHATGTGKSYNALQLAYDNKDKKQFM